MLVCRKDRIDAQRRRPRPAATPRQGGPVFVPRRKPSPLAEALLAHPPAIDFLTSGGEPELRGRAGIGRPRT